MKFTKFILLLLLLGVATHAKCARFSSPMQQKMYGVHQSHLHGEITKSINAFIAIMALD